MMNVCFAEKSGLKRLGYIQNYNSYADELKKLISESFNYDVLNAFINDEIDNKRIYYYNKNFDPVSEDSNEKKYKIINTGYCATDTEQNIYAGFEMKKTWCGASFGTKKEVFERWENESSEENIYNDIFFRNIDSLTTILSKITGKDANDKEVRSLLEEAYKNATNDSSLYIFSSDNGKSLLYFDSGIKNPDGEKIWLVSEPNKKTDAQQKWYGLFFVAQSRLVKRILDMCYFNIAGMVFEDFNQANSFINTLADRAIKEPWGRSSNDNSTYDLPYLKSYLENTYSRLCREAQSKNNKIVKKDGNVYFNTGLLDKFYRQLFICGKECNETKYIDGIGKCTCSYLSEIRLYSENEPEIVAKLTPDEFPEIASYCDNYQDLIFKSSLEIKLQDSHIFEDGVRRHRIPVYEEAFEACKDNAEKYERLMAKISRDFESAVKRMVLLAKRNYTIAVPQYVKEFDEIQFMLPVYLDEDKYIPDCVLSLRLEKDASVPYYRGTTILTTEMAASNSRLIAGPELHWIRDIKSISAKSSRLLVDDEKLF